MIPEEFLINQNNNIEIINSEDNTHIKEDELPTILEINIWDHWIDLGGEG